MSRKDAAKGTSGRARRATIKDVARLAGVSPTAVSFVLNGRGRISDDVSERVRAAAVKLGFRPNSQARAMRTGETRTIGLIIPDLRNPFFPELAEAVGSAAQRNGYAMLIGYANDLAHERESFAQLVHHGVDGICWCPSSGVDTPRELALQTPIVTVDRPGGHYDLVTSNLDMAAGLIADEVSRCGFRKIGLVNGPRGLPTAKLRSAAFRKALKPRCKIEWEIENSFSTEITEANARFILSHPVDAVICANDTIAIGVIRLLKDAQISVPAELSVIGFDDIPWSALVEPQLTTVRQNLSEMGAHAVDLLLERIANPTRVSSTLEVDVGWRGRSSTPSRTNRP